MTSCSRWLIGIICGVITSAPGLAQDKVPAHTSPPVALLGADAPLAQEIPAEFTTADVKLTDAQWVALVKAWKERVKPMEDSVKKTRDATEPLVVNMDEATGMMSLATSVWTTLRRTDLLLGVLTPAQQSIIVAQLETATREACKADANSVLCKLLTPHVTQLRAQVQRGGGAVVGTQAPADLATPTKALTPAKTLIDEGVKAARTSNKVLFLYCYDKRMDAFLHSAEVGKLIADNYVLVRFDNAPGSKALAKEKGLESPGLIFLDSTGKTLATADIVYPEDGVGIWRFGKLLEQTAPRMTMADRIRIMEYLVNNSPG